MTRNRQLPVGPLWLLAAISLQSCPMQAASGAADVSAASSSQGPSSGSVAGAVSDAAITSKVKVKLLSAEELMGSSINVTTANGVVLLKGIVRSADMAEEATQIARSVDGVKAVDNQLTTPVSTNRIAARSAAPPSADVSNALDSQINLKLRDKLLTDDDLKNTQIGITTIDGVVRLFGQVQTDTQRDHATLVARQIEGVKGVDSSGLTVAPAP